MVCTQVLDMDNFCSDTQEPEPCPRCGANPYSWAPTDHHVSVRCTSCDFNGPLRRTGPSGKNEALAERIAVREWNRLSYSTEQT